MGSNPVAGTQRNYIILKFKENCYLWYVLGALPPVEPIKFQKSTTPEVAFIGRSNVGKSSLLNALTGVKNLARTSNTPGKTQQINFFLIEKFITLVDLPGYGYAKIEKAKQVKWSELIEYYFTHSVNLKVILILIDARHGLKLIDEEAIKWIISFGYSWAAVFTKIDKKVKTKLQLEEEVKAACIKKCLLFPTDFFHVSAIKKEGLEQLKGYLKNTIDK